MDFAKAMNIWPTLGADYTFISGDGVGKSFTCWFMIGRQVVGDFKAFPGYMTWCWPDELLDPSWKDWEPPTLEERQQLAFEADVASMEITENLEQ